MLTALLVTVGLSAQTDSAYSYTGTVMLDAPLQANALNAQAHKWVTDKLAENYEVTQTTDLPCGGVMVTARFKYNMDVKKGVTYAPGYVQFTAYVYTAQGKYSYNLTGFTHHVTADDYTAFGLITNQPESQPFMWQAIGSKHKADERLDELQDEVKQRAYYIANGLKKYMALTVGNNP